MQADVVVVLAGVLAGGVVAQWLGWRLRVPAIVFLLAGGLIAGPVTGRLNPDDVFGDQLFPLVSVAVAVVLFEGALGLGWSGVRAAGTTVWMLLSVGAAITLAGTAVAARLVLDVDWSLAALLATVLVVTGPTVIGPIVRSIGLHGRVAAILESEGTLIDPIGAVLTVLTFEAAFGAHNGGGTIVTELLTTLGVGIAVGLGFAQLLIVAFSRYLIPDQLHNVTTLAAVVLGFAVANAYGEESGLVAVTVMGIALASQTRVAVDHVLDFNETLRILAISGLFVLLGARIEASTLREIEWQNLAFLGALVLLIRPAGVFASTIRSRLSFRERLFLACTAPRGIVAAAIASVFSLRLAELGFENSQVLVSATFTVIGGTVLLSGLGSRAIATRLGLVEQGPATIVVLGANPVARELAASLEQHGAPVNLIDLDREALAHARMSGLGVHHGSIFADDTWEAAGMATAGRFLAMTNRDEINALATRHAAAILGRRHVYQLPPVRPEHQAWWTLPAGTFGRPLFGSDANFDKLTSLLDDGWRIRSTPLTDQFGMRDHARTHADAIPLFIVDPKGDINLVADDSKRRPRAGDVLVAFAPTTPA